MYASSFDIPELWPYLSLPEDTRQYRNCPLRQFIRKYAHASMIEQRKKKISGGNTIAEKKDEADATSSWHLGGQARENIRAVDVSPPKKLCSCRIITFRFWAAFSHGSYLIQKKRSLR